MPAAIEHPKHDILNSAIRTIHTVIRRSLESIVDNSDKLTTDTDKIYFANYAHTAMVEIHHHHDLEEEIVFVRIVDKFDKLVKELESEHGELMPTLQEATEFFKAASVDASKFDAQKSKTYAKKVQDILLPHLKKEETTLTGDALFAAYPDQKWPVELLHAVDTRAQADSTPPTVFTGFVYKHLTPEEQDILFVNAPWLVRKLLIPMFGWWYSATWWKYAKTTGGATK